MPKLERHTFVASIDDLWNLAQKNFAKDSTLHNIVIAVNGMSHQKFFMQAPEDDARVTKHGFIPVPGPWVDHLPLLEAEFRAHKTVAAILVGEAWVVRHGAALETIRMDIAPHEHPMKDEMVFVVGFWPREYVAQGYEADIERDNVGNNPRLVRPKQLVPNRASMMASWVQDILPQPH